MFMFKQFLTRVVWEREGICYVFIISVFFVPFSSGAFALPGSLSH